MTMRILIVLLITIALNGCSMLRISYSNIDSFAIWTANDYFDFNNEQREQFNKRFTKIHQWHRQEQLPEYLLVFEDIHKRVQNGIRGNDIIWLVDTLKIRYSRIAQYSANDLADILATLSPSQIDTLKKKLRKENRKFIKDHRSDEGEVERRKEFERRTFKQINEWLGPLSEKQEQMVSNALKTVPLIDQLRHQENLRRQREFLEILELRNQDRSIYTEQLRQFFIHWDSGRTEAVKKQFDLSWAKRAEIYEGLDKTLSTEQRDYLRKKILGYMEDIRSLIKPTSM